MSIYRWNLLIMLSPLVQCFDEVSVSDQFDTLQFIVIRRTRMNEKDKLLNSERAYWPGFICVIPAFRLLLIGQFLLQFRF